MNYNPNYATPTLGADMGSQQAQSMANLARQQVLAGVDAAQAQANGVSAHKINYAPLASLKDKLQQQALDNLRAAPEQAQVNRPTVKIVGATGLWQ